MKMIYKFKLYKKKTYGIIKTRIKGKQILATYMIKNGYYP